MRKQTIASPALATTLAATLAFSLSACGGVPTNRSMYSAHQPVVEKVDYTLDVTTGYAGLAYGEQARLADWFQAMGLKYGDKVYVDDPNASASTRGAVEAVASRYGLQLTDQVPENVGQVAPGTARVFLTRARATVPGCPDWSAKNDFNPGNATSTNYGCAINSNLAAMVANPEDLIHGSGDTGSTVLMTSNKAIQTYRAASPTGQGNKVAGSGSKGD